MVGVHFGEFRFLTDAFHHPVEFVATNWSGVEPNFLSASFKNSNPREKDTKLSSFWDWWGESLFVSIVAKYDIFPAEQWPLTRKKNSGEAILLTLSACTIGIWSTLTYTEFDCAALLAML